MERCKKIPHSHAEYGGVSCINACHNLQVVNDIER